MIKVGIAEDNTRLAQVLKDKVELNPAFAVKLIAEHGEDLVRQLKSDSNLDVVFMDINMPKMDGIKATAKLTERWPHIKVLMLSIYDDEDNIFQAILAGAKGYLLKDEPPQVIHDALIEVMDNGVPMSAEIARKSLALIRNGRRPEEVLPDYGLTQRESEILLHLSKGLSYGQIAENLIISSGTVRKHVENIYRKLQVNNRVEAIRKSGF